MTLKAAILSFENLPTLLNFIFIHQPNLHKLEMFRVCERNSINGNTMSKYYRKWKCYVFMKLRCDLNSKLMINIFSFQ